MVAMAGCVTGEVPTANSAPNCPAGIDAFPATVAAALLDANDTGVPPAGAGLVSVTTPVTGPPPTCELGVRVIDKVPAFCVPAGWANSVPVTEYRGVEAVIAKPVVVATSGT
jgi:hypothetical protein